MTWKRMKLLCEAVRRITRFKDDNPGGMWCGVGFPTDYETVVTAGWMKSVDKVHPRKLWWFKLTQDGQDIVDELMEAGLTYKHIEATIKQPITSTAVKFAAVASGMVSCDVEVLFRDPVRFLASRVFRGKETLPDLDVAQLQSLAPRGSL